METLHIENELGLDVVVEKALMLLVHARKEKSASVLALSGDLGAGKTAFTKKLGEVLGVTDIITSPTFVIMKQYETGDSVPFEELIHIDAYKIENIDEMRPLGFSALLAKEESLICIEWAEHIKSLLPEHTVYIRMETGTTSDESRIITFS